MKLKNTIKDIYKDGTGFRYFLMCILISGLSYFTAKDMRNAD